jgi:hypothetical protein
MNKPQIYVPQAIRPIPTINKGFVGWPFSPIGKFFDFVNYSSKIIPRVNQLFP